MLEILVFTLFEIHVILVGTADNLAFRTVLLVIGVVGTMRVHHVCPGHKYWVNCPILFCLDGGFNHEFFLDANFSELGVNCLTKDIVGVCF